MMKCKICSKVKGRIIFLSKLDFLIKHSRMRKCIVARPMFVIGENFLSPTNTHVKNENLFAFKA